MSANYTTRPCGTEDARPVAIRIVRRKQLWCVDIRTVAGTAKLGGAPNHSTAIAFAEREAARLQVPILLPKALRTMLAEAAA